MDESVLLKQDFGAVRLLTLNRPQVANALNIPLVNALDVEMQALEGASGIRSVVITGAGSRAFAAGADVAELRSLTPLSAVQYSQRGHAMMRRIDCLPMPVIAAVNGYALGGGLELALACDFIYACQSAQLGLVEANLGLIPGYGGIVRLAHRIGEAAAREALFAARRYNAQEALNLGLVNRVIPDASLVEETLAVAQVIAQKSSATIGLLRAVLRQTRTCDQNASAGVEQNAFGLAFTNPDSQEGIDAFLEKRQPEFHPSN